MLTIWDKKTKLVACESIYWRNISDEIEKDIKNCSTFLDCQQTQSKEKTMHHKIPAKPWEILGAHMFTFHNRNYLCIVDYHSKFPAIRKTEDLPAYSSILTCKIIFFSEYGLPKKIISDSGNNFISDKFKTFCRSLNKEQTVSSSYYHQRNGQVEACIRFMKQTLK